MHCAELHLAGAKPIVQRVSAGLFILPQEVQVKTSNADAMPIAMIWR